MYKENPKSKDSGIYCCIPQKGNCPIGCSDCFFNRKESYLQPFEQNLPNMPPLELVKNNVVRVNDGNDSNNQRDLVIESTKQYPMKFYNTSIPTELEKFDAPVVLTINPHKMTDKLFYKLDPIPQNLMFVRVRTNTWNIRNVVNPAVSYYTKKKIPVILTFMAYFTTQVKEGHEKNYTFRKRTLNSYNAITTNAWDKIMRKFRLNPYIYSCGKIEGELGITSCSRCGNCLREYFCVMERLKNNGERR